MKQIALLAVLVATPALADDRILLEPPLPSWCSGDRLPSGNCVKGATYYRLESGKVIWRVDRDPTDPKFWEYQDRERGGSDLSGSSSAGTASK